MTGHFHLHHRNAPGFGTSLRKFVTRRAAPCNMTAMQLPDSACLLDAPTRG